MSSAIEFLFMVPSWLRRRARHPLDDAIDRLSSTYSVVFMFACFSLSVSNLVFGDSMSCWTNKEFPSHWAKFYAFYCYIQPQTVISVNGHFRQFISYFPWIPYFIVLQGVMFLLPRMFWHFIASRSELDLHTVLEEAKKVSLTIGKARQAILEQLSNFMVAHLEFTHNGSRKFFFVFQSPTAVVYLIHKWAYFANVIAQFFFLVIFLGSGDMYWGFNALKHSLRSDTAGKSPVFPLQTVCRVPEIVDGEPRERVIDCLMTFNIVYEKVYIGIYFWLLFLGMIAFSSATVATITLFVPCIRNQVIMNRLRRSHAQMLKKRLVQKFLDCSLHADGLLALQLINTNCGHETADDLTRMLFASFSANFRKQLSHIPFSMAPNENNALYPIIRGTAPPAEEESFQSQTPLMERLLHMSDV